jgi:hypothetical protein
MSDARHNPLAYAPPGTHWPRPRRSLGRWLILLLVWGVGLLIWTVYLAIIVLLVFRLFGHSPL